VKKLYHPICHFIHGERLYYIVISFKHDAFNSASFLIDKLEKLEIINSSCAHLIFGDMDVIIRVWSDEKSITALKNIIDEYKMVSNYRLLLIESNYTWYKEKINKKISKLEFEAKLVDNILRGDIDSHLYLILKNNSKSMYSYKYWIFVEEPYSSNSNFYSKFRDILGNRGRKHPNLEDSYHISVYSYLTGTRRGLLLKCSTNTFVKSCDNISQLIEDFSADNDYKITTYIARKELKEDSDQINTSKTIHLPIEARKKEIIYNLFKSHDCYRGMFEGDSKEANLIDSFCFNLSPLFYDIFRFHNTWCDKIRQARNALKWVVEQKNATLVSVLLREYVLLEIKLRKILEDIYRARLSSIKGLDRFGRKLQNQYKIENVVISEIISMIEVRFVPQKLTLGDIPHLLSLLANSCKTDNKYCDLIKKFPDIVAAISNDRNSLAHGEDAFLFQHDKNSKKWLWEQYAFNFMNYHFFNPKWANILRDRAEIYKAEQKRQLEAV
jgi:hypothetical protein